jgi:hypothetical protein
LGLSIRSVEPQNAAPSFSSRVPMPRPAGTVALRLRSAMDEQRAHAASRSSPRSAGTARRRWLATVAIALATLSREREFALIDLGPAQALSGESRSRFPIRRASKRSCSDAPRSTRCASRWSSPRSTVFPGR